MSMMLSERREMMDRLFDPDDVHLPPKRRRDYHLSDPGRRARRDQRALRQGLRFCGVCKGRGTSLKVMRRALGHTHGRDRVPEFYVYAYLTRAEHRELMAKWGRSTPARKSKWRRTDGSEIADPQRHPTFGWHTTDPKRINADERDDDRAYFEIPWFTARLACWACGGSGFNCSAEMARALEVRCHTQQGHSLPPNEGGRL